MELAGRDLAKTKGITQLEKIVIAVFLLAIFLFVYTSNVSVPPDQSRQIAAAADSYDVVLVVNSGGWGDDKITFSRQDDFMPVVEGIKATLEKCGCRVTAIPYFRTWDSLNGRVAMSKDFLNSYEITSVILASDLETVLKENPEASIVLAGLSTGGSLVLDAYNRLSEKTKDSVCVISLGAPFHFGDKEQENVLRLDNEGKDRLARGELLHIAMAMLTSPVKWFKGQFEGDNRAFTRYFLVPGHEYFWNTPQVKEPIQSFLQDKFEGNHRNSFPQ